MLTFALFLPAARLPAADDVAREPPRIKPLEPEAALKSFQIHAGFRLEIAASEPLVTDPVSACYDADGRLYVVEMRGYPYPENTPSGNVSLLRDLDGDGRFDKATVFLDGLSWPTGVVPYDGGVFIAAAPEIVYAKDTNGDGVADVRKVMFRGFGTQNVQGLFNGLLWGPDGWIYGVSGTNGGDVANLVRPDARPVSVRGRDFRFRPDGSAFEAVSGGGQFGHSFDDWGRRFTCMNSNHIRQIVLPSRYLERNPALAGTPVVDDIAEEGGAAPVFRVSAAEPWRIVRTRQRAADPEMSKKLPPTELVAIGFFTSATGVTIYRGDAFPPEYRGNAFIGDVGGNLVHRKILTPRGAEFRARRADAGVEFLASADNWFRPVNFVNTPEGTLLILDMYRETIEHPLSIPEPIKKHLDLTSGKDRGRIYKLVHEKGTRRDLPQLGRATNAELVAHLADPSAWSRETAQRLLIERRALDAVPALRELAKARPTPLARAHAIWTLDILGSLADDDLLPAFKDPEPGLREQAAKLSETHLKPGSRLVEPLLNLARDPDAMVRFQAALSLGELPAGDPRGLDALAEIAAHDPGDRWTRAAVLSAIPRRAAAFLARLADRDPALLTRPEGRPWLAELTLVVGVERDPAAIRDTLARCVLPGANPDAARAVVLGIGSGLKRAGGSPRDFFRNAGLAPLFERAAQVAHAPGPIPTRVESVRLLADAPLDQALAVVPNLLDPRQPIEVQLAALQTLGELPDQHVATLILERWKGLGPAARREAIEALFSRPERVDQLLSALEKKAFAPNDLEPARRAQLLRHPATKVRERAQNLLGNDRRPNRDAVLAAFQPALALAGDRNLGKAVFVKVCAACHRAEGAGTEVGPNLATVVGRSPADLLVHILDPNREVASNFVNYVVATVDGRILTGLVADESADAVTLRRAGGLTDVLPRDRIESIASTGLSLMPEGLEVGLEPRDFANLIAYLTSLRAEPSASPAAPKHAAPSPAKLERVVVSKDGNTFITTPSGTPFRPLGFNYDHDVRGRLIEEYWRDEWPKVEQDFAEMKALGANVVRVHLQAGRFLPSPDTVDKDNLERLGKLLELAERTGLRIDLTGLGCYTKQDVPKWYDALDEAGRWAAQVRFWEAIASVCAKSPAIFCYDLMNEPLVPGGKQAPGTWLGTGPGFGGKYYVQLITLDPAGQTREQVARRWLVTLRDAIRRRDREHLITVGLVDWSLDRPGVLFSGITPKLVDEILDFVCIHLYPDRGKVDEALATLKAFSLGKPVVIEETFPLKCSIEEFARFATDSRKTAAGLIGFYWGETIEDLRAQKTIPAAITAAWLEAFRRIAGKVGAR